MNKKAAPLFLLVLASIFSASLPAQVLRHETTTINIEIPVRVFKGDTFIDNLTIADFEVYEDGKLQSLEAVYLARKTVIERREETTPLLPDTNRHFFLFFEMTEYDPKIREALNYFVDEVLLPGDELVIVTPMKTYRMKVYEVNPLSCPRCQGEMRIISFLTDYAVVDRIIAHLKLTFVAERPPPPHLAYQEFLMDSEASAGYSS